METTRPTGHALVDRFDALTRALATSGSRRQALGLLAGSLGLLAVSAGEAEAHDLREKCKEIRSKKKRRKCIKEARRHKAEHEAETPRCDEGLTTCAGACHDVKTSKEHCGACNNACQGLEVCQSGDCCRPSFVLCTDVCAAGSDCSICCSGFCFSDNTC